MIATLRVAAPAAAHGEQNPAYRLFRYTYSRASFSSEPFPRKEETAAPKDRPSLAPRGGGSQNNSFACNCAIRMSVAAAANAPLGEVGG